MSTRIEAVPMKFHPRAFSAFGADLVTNDCVAIAELVKNCYDAFASNVSVSISSDCIEIKDDGIGMTPEVIREAWAVIATPYKKKAPIVRKGDKIRRVSGNKGLGRFSAARLGRYLTIVTKSEASDLIEARIDWESLSNSDNMSECKIDMVYLGEDAHAFPSVSGTIIRITSLYEAWSKPKIQELINSLSRLLSPFENTDDFIIWLKHEDYANPIQITPQDFIRHPTYSISGHVLEDGSVTWSYQFAPKARITTQKNGVIPWQEACNGFESAHTLEITTPTLYTAGPFSFEIRAWDLDASSIADVADSFNIGKREIRSSIAQYKGLSVYRDNVLVLPKSDASKDWLGIDIRRVSLLGKRISTSQIIGMINISAEENPEIKDTTDREKLVDTQEYKQFCKVIETIVETLENLRYADKKPPEKKPRGLNDLISPLSALPLVSKLEEEINRGHNTDQLVETVRDFAAENEKTLGELSERLTYYAQTASLGSVAVVILHEILTGMTVMKRFITRIRQKCNNRDSRTEEYLSDAESWHLRLVDVAKSFAPLYRRTLISEHNTCNVKMEIVNCIRMISENKLAKNITFESDCSDNIIASVHSGELQTIIINLLDNAVYWVNYSKKSPARILISVDKNTSGTIEVSISDTGVGIEKEDAEKIFQPGITSKPHGIGMGLVIVTELLSRYNCKVGTVVPGLLGGATFLFDLPEERN